MRTERPIHLFRASLAAALVCSFAACTTGNEPVKLTPSQAATSASQTATPNAATAATARPNAPVNPHAGMQPGGAAPKTAGALQYSVPEGWVVQIPSSNMRKAQFQLPKIEGDTEDAQLILYYFGGEGGSTDDNLKRWAGQFVQPDGRDSMDVLVTSTRTVNDMKVTEASISGTFDAEMMPGMGDRVRREKWSMLAAIVESPSGPYYAKLTGPMGTVSKWEASFRTWVSSLKPTSG